MSTVGDLALEAVQSLDVKTSSEPVNGEQHLHVHDTRVVGLLELVLLELQTLNANLAKPAKG